MLKNGLPAMSADVAPPATSIHTSAAMHALCYNALAQAIEALCKTLVPLGQS